MGERILAPRPRPVGNRRKLSRIRPGYVPRDEAAIYQSKGALLTKACRGYDPALIEKPTRVRVSDLGYLERVKSIDLWQAEEMKIEEVSSAVNIAQIGDSSESVAQKMGLAFLSETSTIVRPTSLMEIKNPSLLSWL